MGPLSVSPVGSFVTLCLSCSNSATIADPVFVRAAGRLNNVYGLRSDGVIESDNTDPAWEGLEEFTGRYMDFSAEDDVKCGVGWDRSLECSVDDDDDFGQAADDDGPYVMVRVTDVRTCAMDPIGHVDCWGPGYHAPDYQGEPAPDLVEIPDDHFLDFDIGAAGGCGVRHDGSIRCWGAEPGDPILRPPDGDWASVALGSAACALDHDGYATCWDDDAFDADPPADVQFVELEVAQTGACGLQPNGDLTCWGSEDADEPMFGGELSTWEGPYKDVAIDSGQINFCMVTLEGAISCVWGSLSHGDPWYPEP